MVTHLSVKISIHRFKVHLNTKDTQRNNIIEMTSFLLINNNTSTAKGGAMQEGACFVVNFK